MGRDQVFDRDVKHAGERCRWSQFGKASRPVEVGPNRYLAKPRLSRKIGCAGNSSGIHCGSDCGVRHHGQSDTEVSFNSQHLCIVPVGYDRQMSTATRIRRAMDAVGVRSAAELARLARINEVTARAYLNGTRELSAYEPAARIASALSTTVEAILGVRQTRQSGIPASISHIPLVSWVSAGMFADVGQAMIGDDFPLIEMANLPDGDWFALTVEGDSMDRISPPGSIILVNRRDRKLVPNGCYVIANEDGQATYKRFRPSPDRFEPVSVNPNHDPLFPDGAVRVIGRVRRSILDM